MYCGILQQQLDHINTPTFDGQLQWSASILILGCFTWVAPVTEGLIPRICTLSVAVERNQVTGNRCIAAQNRNMERGEVGWVQC